MPAMIRRRSRVAPHRRTRTSMIAAAALVLLLAVAGNACSSSSDSGSTTSTTTAANAEAAVRQTLEGWAQAFSRAKTNPTGTHPELLRYATTAFVREQHTIFDRLISRGWRIGRPTDSKEMFEVRSVTIRGAHATAGTCSIADIDVINVQSGAFVERQTATSTETWFLQRVGQRWLINHTQVSRALPGVKPCTAQ